MSREIKLNCQTLAQQQLEEFNLANIQQEELIESDILPLLTTDPIEF